MKYHWNIIGHEKILEQLEYELETEFQKHAFLFVGPQHIGKFSILRRLSQILQCADESCCWLQAKRSMPNQRLCPICLQIEKGGHLDTIEAHDDGSSLKIEQTREFIARLNMTSQSRCKILLLENIGRLTEEAGNSLLKMIEEPPEKTYFFFTAESLREVLPTIQSRMHVVKLSAPPHEQFLAFLQQCTPNFSEDKRSTIELLSFGKPGKAMTFLENPEILEAARERYEAVRRFCLGFSLTNRFRYIQELKEDTPAIREFLATTVAFLRYLLFRGSPQEQALASTLLPKTVETYERLRKNTNPRLLLEHLALAFQAPP